MPAILLALLPLLPQLAKAGMDIAPLVELAIEKINGKPVTQADWDTLHQHEDALRSRLNDTSKDVR